MAVKSLTPFALVIAAPLAAQTPLAAPLGGIGFLVGDWEAGQGQVAETGSTSSGRSTITVEAGGHALLRRDHTDLFDAAGKPIGGFEQIMLVYPEGGTLRADYSDGAHVIHYSGAEVVAGRSVTFTTAAQPGAPRFRLGYALAAPTVLAVTFEMAPPGGTGFRPIATGTLTKAR